MRVAAGGVIYPTIALTLGPLARGAALLAVCALALTAIAPQFGQVRALDGDDAERAEWIDCPSCGSRVPTGPDACAYRGESLEGGAER